MHQDDVLVAEVATEGGGHARAARLGVDVSQRPCEATLRKQCAVIGGGGAVAHLDQADALLESIAFDGGDGGGDGQRHQVVTATEGVVLDGGQPLGQRDLGQAGVGKRLNADDFDAGGDVDLGQGVAPREGEVSDGGHAVGDDAGFATEHHRRGGDVNDAVVRRLVARVALRHADALQRGAVHADALADRGQAGRQGNGAQRIATVNGVVQRLHALHQCDGL